MQSKTENKLRLDFFLAQGLKLVGGDMPVGVDGAGYHLDASEAHDWNDADSNDFHRHIKSLAPRENKGVQPVGDDVVIDVVFEDGYAFTEEASLLEWGFDIERHNHRIKTWKPSLDALIELQEKHKVTQVKPEVDYWMVTTTETGWVARIAKHGLSVYVKDVVQYGYSVRIRPVYKKRDTHHSK